MPVVVIDTIKPKNNLTFPIVEDVDVLIKASGARLSEVVANMATAEQITALQNAIAGKASIESVEALTSLVNSKADAADLTALSATVADKADKSALAETNEAVSAKASAADLAATNATVATKADTTAVTAATADLQGQIDQIVISSSAESVVAPEVAAARTNANGVTYSTLKARLDSDNANVNKVANAQSKSATMEIGGINTTGYKVDSSTRARTVDRINYNTVFDKVTFAASTKHRFVFYTEDSTSSYVSMSDWSTDLIDTVILPIGMLTGYFHILVGYTDDRTITDANIPAVSVSISEVAAARVDSSNTEYATLKARLDADAAKPYQFRGELTALGYAAISDAVQIGCYSSLTTTTANLQDKPAGLIGPFSLFVNSWLTDGVLAPVQLLIDKNGNVWQRFLRPNGTTIIDWASSATEIAANTQALGTLNSKIYELEDFQLRLTSNKYWDVSGTEAELKDIDNNTFFASEVIPVAEGDSFVIHAAQGDSHKVRVWTLCDDNMEIVAKADDSYDNIVRDVPFTVPSGATKLVVTVRNYEAIMTPYLKQKVLITDVINQDLTRIESDLYKNYQQLVSFVGQGISIDGRPTDNSARARTGLISTNADILTINAAQGYKFRAAYYTDGLTIETAAFSHLSDWIEGNGSDVKLETGYYIRLLCGYSDDSIIENLEDFETNIKVYKEKNRIDVLESEVNVREGLKLSLLGDSISAYAGTIPAGNDAYYTGGNSGVNSPEQMWWSVLCQKTGMEPLVINGWSGSGVTQLTDSAHQSKVPMSDTSRSQALHSGVTTPDVVIIAGGVNDYSYAQQASQIPGNWDGKTAPVKGNSFTETYACMIKDIQTAYPNAVVICLSTWFTMRGTDNGYTLTNGEGYTQSDYDREIERVASLMRVSFIDVEKCGFSRSNFYPTYAVDSSTIPTHPNAAGQKVMGEYIANLLPQIIKAIKD